MAELPRFSQSAGRTVLTDFPVYVLSIFAAGHLDVAMGTFGVSEKTFNAQLWSAILLANCMLDHEGLSADVVSTTG